MGTVRLNPFGDLFEKEGIQGGLCDNDRLIECRQGLHVFQAFNHMPFSAGKPQKTDDFRMIPVANDHRGETFSGMFQDDALNLDDPRTGGINDSESGFF